MLRRRSEYRVIGKFLIRKKSNAFDVFPYEWIFHYGLSINSQNLFEFVYVVILISAIF